MSRINTNVTSLIAQRNYANNQQQLTTSLERLSTGLKINSGADDPAGLIASQNLKAETTGITAAISNANLAGNILGTAEGGLSETSNLLTQVQTLLTSSANTGGLSSDEQAANQQQIDSILSTLNRVSDSTSFQGTKLLNGTLAYNTSSVGTSAITDLQVNAASVQNSTTAQAVTVKVLASARTAVLTSKFSGTTTGTLTVELSGKTGTTQLTFASGTSLASIKTAINGESAVTGASAATSGVYLKLNSQDFGSDAFVGLKAITGALTSESAQSATGRDATVTVNGNTASADGKNVSFRSGNLDVSFTLANAVNTNSGSKTFGITGGGATFSLSSTVTESGKASIGIQSVAAGDLGTSALGYLSSLGSGGANSLSSGNIQNAQKILDSSISQVSTLRGRIGAFQTYTIDSTVNSLNVAFENASSAESAIADTDFAAETANLSRAEILSQAAESVLSTANSSPKDALSLLQG